MFKLFAIMCLLVNGEVQCQAYDDSDRQIFDELYKCEQQAEYRFYGMMDYFTAYRIPYERIIVGCDEVET